MSLPLDDRGLLLGDGLFETMLALNGEMVRPEAHLARMAAGCAVLDLPAPDPAETERLLLAAVQGVDAPRAAVRLTLTAGSGGRGLDRPADMRPRLFATAAPSAKPAGPARLSTSAVRRNDGSPASRLKTLAYLDNVLAREAARTEGADEALMLNTRGEIACGAAANVFWIRQGQLFTPALDCGVLAGLARADVIGAARDLGIETQEVHAAVADLTGVEAMFLTNSLIGVRMVSDWDGRAMAASSLADRLALAAP